jgi:hypothetical protein
MPMCYKKTNHKLNKYGSTNKRTINTKRNPTKALSGLSEGATNSTDEEFVAQKMVEIFCGIRLVEVAKIKLTSSMN